MGMDLLECPRAHAGICEALPPTACPLSHRPGSPSSSTTCLVLSSSSHVPDTLRLSGFPTISVSSSHVSLWLILLSITVLPQPLITCQFYQALGSDLMWGTRLVTGQGTARL